MNKPTKMLPAVLLVVISTAVLFGYRKWGIRYASSTREEALALLPTDASAVFFADFDELHKAPFIAQLYEWAPKPQADADYSQFVRETGFDYERDLDRVAVAIEKHGPESALFAILDGKFDRQKIPAYALKDGSATKSNGYDIYSVTVTGTAKKISFAFLKNDRMALTNDSNLTVFPKVKNKIEGHAEWRERFERLAGSPVFAVIRQDAAIGSSFASQAPGGLRAPQLSTLLDQLQWITLAGKPENDRLRMVAEGESTAEATTRQLVDVMNGVVILAEAGLNDPKNRQQLDPTTRQAYLDLLRSVDVSKIDRGDTKSVRLAFEITPAFLNTARTSSPAAPESTPSKPRSRKTAPPKNGRT